MISVPAMVLPFSNALVPSSTGPTGPGCEITGAGWLQEPVAALSSLAFVVAAAAIPSVAARGRRRAGQVRSRSGEREPDVLTYAALVASVGVGSVLQHGPDPAWSDVAHDAPLIAVLAFVAADAAADLSGRRRPLWSWLVPTAALVPLVLMAPRAGDLAQAGLAGVAVVLTLLRGRRNPALRGRIGVAIALLALGGLIGTLSRAGGPLCDPESPWQGHAAWHVLASGALVVLAPLIARTAAEGNRRRPPGAGSAGATGRRPRGG